MTELQGHIYKIQYNIQKRIDNVICQSFKNTFDTKEFSEKLVNKVTEKFGEPLSKNTSQSFYESFTVEKYKPEIKNGILDGIEKNKNKIKTYESKLRSYRD